MIPGMILVALDIHLGPNTNQVQIQDQGRDPSRATGYLCPVATRLITDMYEETAPGPGHGPGHQGTDPWQDRGHLHPGLLTEETTPGPGQRHDPGHQEETAPGPGQRHDPGHHQGTDP